MSKILIGIIGAGGIAAKMHLPELAEERARAEVVLLSGRRESRLKRLCDLFDVPNYTTDYDAVIADDSIDAICIATPHLHHVSWGIAALEAGKDIFIQKPLCGDMVEADAIVAAAEKHPDRIVYCLPHFNEITLAARDRIVNGDLGKIASARVRTSHGGPELYYEEILSIFGEKPPEDLWFFDSKRAGVGALFDMGVYAVAQIVALLGSAKRVSALTATIDKPTDLEDTATLILEMENGTIATAETSWCDPARTWSIGLHGTKAKIDVPNYHGDGATLSRRVTAVDGTISVESENLRKNRSFGSSHAHFLDSIETGKQPPLSNIYAARHVTEILLQALESAKTGQVQPIQSRADR